MSLVIGLAVWGVVAFLDLGPNPPGATTSLSASTNPQAWAQGRRTPENTGFTPEQAPIPQTVKWTYATSMPLVSSPAVVDDRVYLTTEDGRTIALHRQTGQPIWEYRSDFPSSSTPAVAGDLVFFGLRPGLIVALDRETGTLQWEKDIRSPILASPIVVNGSLYLGTADSKLFVLDATTGQELWTFKVSDWIISSVAYAGDTVVVASKDNVVHIVGAKSGRNRLGYNTGRGRRIGAGGPAIQGDLAYFGTRGGKVWAIDRRATNYPLERTVLFWKTNLFVWGILSSPPVQKGSVWSKQVGGDVTQVPAIAHDTVYITNTQGKVIALDAATGENRWATELGMEITAAPTVAGKQC